MSKRYTTDERRCLIDLIREMKAKGKTYPEMAQELNDRNITMLGGTQWTGPKLGGFLSANRKMAVRRGVKMRKYVHRMPSIKKTAETKPAAKVAKVSYEQFKITVVKNLLKDPNLNDTQRVKMLCSYLDA